MEEHFDINLTLARHLFLSLHEKGGFTTNEKGEEPTTGHMVGVESTHEMLDGGSFAPDISGVQFDLNELSFESFLVIYGAFMSAFYGMHRCPENMYFGAWTYKVDSGDNEQVKVCFDYSVHVEDQADAIMLGYKNKQRAIYNVRSKKSTFLY